MINRIQEHHNDEEIEVFRLQNEVRQWKTELEFINQEISFYLELFNSELLKPIEVNKIDIKSLSNKLLELKKNSKYLKTKCAIFSPKLEDKNECEDIQCDHAYLIEHILLRQEIDKHMNDIRKIKSLSFEYVRSGIKKT